MGVLTCLGFLLIGLAVGLWPSLVYPYGESARWAPLPTLQCLGVAQAMFILLAWPLQLRRAAGHGVGPSHPSVAAILAARNASVPPASSPDCEAEAASACGGETPATPETPLSRENAVAFGHTESLREYLTTCAAQGALYLAVATPFYVAAAWLSDAIVVDCLRLAAYLACLCPLAWWGGWMLAHRPAAASVVLISLLVAALGLPAAWYIVRDLGSSANCDWLWRVSPATCAYALAASRQPPLPAALWPMLLWPALAVAAAALAACGKRPSRE